jgi:hypothetical protein
MALLAFGEDRMAHGVFCSKVLFNGCAPIVLLHLSNDIIKEIEFLEMIRLLRVTGNLESLYSANF